MPSVADFSSRHIRLRTLVRTSALWLCLIGAGASWPGAGAAQDAGAADAYAREWRDWSVHDWGATAADSAPASGVAPDRAPETPQAIVQETAPDTAQAAGQDASHTIATGIAPAAEPESQAVSEPTLAQQVADWVIASGDNRGLPFAVIDKVAAEVAVYGADGQLRGAGPALLGLARGDGSTPGVGDRELSDIAPEERTTPAGRFLAAYGPATGGKRVLWVDYATAISLHPVVTANRKERRLQRLKSAEAEDNRITFGCINVAADFYEDVVRPSFTGTEGIVYVLPEVEALAQVLPAFRPQAVVATAALGQAAAGP